MLTAWRIQNHDLAEGVRNIGFLTHQFSKMISSSGFLKVSITAVLPFGKGPNGLPSCLCDVKRGEERFPAKFAVYLDR